MEQNLSNRVKIGTEFSLLQSSLKLYKNFTHLGSRAHKSFVFEEWRTMNTLLKIARKQAVLTVHSAKFGQTHVAVTNMAADNYGRGHGRITWSPRSWATLQRLDWRLYRNRESPKACGEESVAGQSRMR